MLNSITIKNFRSITDLSLDNLGQINLLFGENNCGKTSVLEAILCLTSGKKNSLPFAIRNLLNTNNNKNIPDNENAKFLFNNSDITKDISISADSDDNIKFILNADIKNISDSDLENYSSKDQTIKTINSLTLQYIVNGQNEKSLKIKFNKGKAKTGEQNLESKVIPDCVFINEKSTVTILEEFKDIQENSKKTSQIVEILKQIDSSITDLRLDKNGNIIVNTNSMEPMPIEMMGDGIIKALAISIAIFGKHGIILIDEIENGLHHKSQDIVWKAIIEWAKEYNIQFFITTHSYEMIERLTCLLDEQNENILKAFRIERDANEFKAVDFNTDELSYMTSKRWEVR